MLQRTYDWQSCSPDEDQREGEDETDFRGDVLLANRGLEMVAKLIDIECLHEERAKLMRV
jgi:hypothetical protein